MMQPLDYAPPLKLRPTTSFALTIGLGVPTALVCILAIFIAPVMEAVFSGLKVNSYLETDLLFDFSRWIRSGFGWLFVWAVPAVIPMIITQLFPRRFSKPSRKLNRGIVIWSSMPICLVIVVAVFEAWAIPLMFPMHMR